MKISRKLQESPGKSWASTLTALPQVGNEGSPLRSDLTFPWIFLGYPGIFLDSPGLSWRSSENGHEKTRRMSMSGQGEPLRVHLASCCEFPGCLTRVSRVLDTRFTTVVHEFPSGFYHNFQPFAGYFTIFSRPPGPRTARWVSREESKGGSCRAGSWLPRSVGLGASASEGRSEASRPGRSLGKSQG